MSDVGGSNRTLGWALAIAAVHFGQRRLPSLAESTEPLDSCAAQSHGPQNFRILARIQHVARLGSRFCLETHLGRLCLDIRRDKLPKSNRGGGRGM
jgi:hypothetical protein